MTKTRFIVQKVIIAAMLVASLVTAIPFIMLVLETQIWSKEPDDSLLLALVEIMKTKYEDI